MKHTHWQTTQSSYVVESPFLRLRRDSVRLPDGTLIEDYFVREGRAFAVIFAMTPEQNVVLIRQFRYGIGRVLLELPAGIIDEGESPPDCAARELAEETGYVGEHIAHLTTLLVDPSNANTTMHLYLVRDARSMVKPQTEATEEIQVELATLDELLLLVRNGAVEAMGQVASIYFALDYLRQRETCGDGCGT